MVMHFSSLNVDSFRGINDLELEDLGKINILVGANNCGKTTLLEAIMVLNNSSNFGNVVRVSRLRDLTRLNMRMGISNYDSFLYLFNRLNKSLYLSVTGILDGDIISTTIKGNIEKVLLDIEAIKKHARLWKNDSEMIEGEEMEVFRGELIFEEGSPSISIPIDFNKYSDLKTVNYGHIKFISAIDHLINNNFGEIVSQKELKNEVVEMLGIFDEHITDLRIIQNDNGRMVQVVDHALLGYLPVSSYGDGIKKVIALANGIAGAKHGVLLVDEIETSIHASILKQVISYLYTACKKNNVQLFVTTHSLEVVDMMLNADDSAIEDDRIRVITLVKKPDRTIARILKGEKALQVRDDYDMELRS